MGSQKGPHFCAGYKERRIEPPRGSRPASAPLRQRIGAETSASGLPATGFKSPLDEQRSMDLKPKWQPAHRPRPWRSCSEFVGLYCLELMGKLDHPDGMHRPWSYVRICKY
jgi:hypothetical protein